MYKIFVSGRPIASADLIDSARILAGIIRADFGTAAIRDPRGRFIPINAF